MMETNHKLSFKYAVRENWWKVLIIFAVFTVAVGITAEEKLKITYAETIEIFIEGELLDKEFNRKMIDKIASPNILQVTTTAVSKDNSNFISLLKTEVGICSDILVLDNDVLKETGDVYYTTYNGYSTKEIEFLNSKYSDLAALTVSNKFGGYKIYDAEDANYNSKFNFTKSFTFTTTSYLIIDKTSGNLKTNHNSGFSDSFVAFCSFLDIYI